MSLPDKVQTIKDVNIPTNINQLRSSISVIHDYKHSSHILTVSCRMAPKQAMWEWDKYCQKVIILMNHFEWTLIPAKHGLR